MPNQNQTHTLKLCPLGDSAVELQFGVEASQQVRRQIHGMVQALQRQPFSGMLEYVPAYTSLTVHYNAWQLSDYGKKDAYEEVVQHLEALLEQAQELEPQASRLIEVPVVYGGTFGPDLEDVAQHTGLSPQQVVELHSNREYEVYMIGFVPGFPYLGGMDDQLITPRKATPRPVIPAGAVGIAGAQTGVYPLVSPGGWQLIGRTPLTLFDSNRPEPALLRAGDRVKFIPIPEEDWGKEFDA